MDLTDLPGATLEELFTPSEIVAVRTGDGNVRLLMYCGNPDEYGTFPALKSAVIAPHHAAGLVAGLQAEA